MSGFHGNLMNDGFAYMRLISLCFKFMGYLFGHSGFIDFYLAPLKEIAHLHMKRVLVNQTKSILWISVAVYLACSSCERMMLYCCFTLFD